MKAPANIVSSNKYTVGNEFIYADTYENYQGYYYEISDKFFVGKSFNSNAKELLKLSSEKVDKARLNSKTSLFSKLSKVILPVAAARVPSILFNGSTPTRYFIKQLNVSPMIIKEVDKKTFGEFENNSLYQRASINLPSNDDFDPAVLDEAEKKMSGLKAFLIG